LEPSVEDRGSIKVREDHVLVFIISVKHLQYIMSQVQNDINVCSLGDALEAYASAPPKPVTPIVKKVPTPKQPKQTPPQSNPSNTKEAPPQPKTSSIPQSKKAADSKIASPQQQQQQKKNKKQQLLLLMKFHSGNLPSRQ